MTDTTFDDIHALLSAADLEDIVVHEERARRVQWEEGGDEDSQTLSLGMSVIENAIHCRFRMVMTAESTEYVADFEARYRVAEAEKIVIPEPLQQEFASRVAFMAVYPFIRVSVYGGASRLGAPRPILGLIRQGEFRIGEKMPAEEARATFFDNKSELATP